MTIDNGVARRYPYPGKYEGGLATDPLLHSLSLDGWADSECGDCQEYGVHYSRIDGPIKDWSADQEPADPALTEDERQALGRLAGVIVSVDEQGFVCVEYFEVPEALEDRWRACLEETAPDDSDSD